MNILTEYGFPYTPFSTFCVRTPVLSWDFYWKLTGSDEILNSELRKQLDLPIISEAIYLASPELHFQLMKWKNEEFYDDKKEVRIKSSLLKYLTRMSTRCTPFGLFAGIGVGRFDAETKIVVGRLERKTHFDMHFLANFSKNLSNNVEIKSQLLFFPNSSIYRIGDRYRYVEYQYKNNRRFYTLESIAFSNYLENVLNMARKGAKIDDLVHLLGSISIDLNEAKHFIDELIENQILVSDLEPSISGKDFLGNIKDRLASIRNAIKDLENIDELEFFLKFLDTRIGNSQEDYDPIKKLVSELQIPFEEKYFIQTDSYREFKKDTLDISILEKIKQGVIFLNKVGEQRKNLNLEKFKSAFIKRFEEEKVSLLHVLDVESGIGYVQNSNSLEDTPFIDDIVYPIKNEGRSKKIEQSLLQSVLHKKIGKSLREDKQTIQLLDTDFPDTICNWENTADTLSLLTEIILENGEEKIAMDFCSPHAAKLLGRFGNGNNEIDELLKDISEIEVQMNPGYIMAEIIHLPESRTGNILRRPQLSIYEIPYLGKSCLPLEQQIPLNDIQVSVENDTIVLYSKKLNRPIIPKLSNAHNYSFNSLPVYHFLCDLQSQKRMGFSFQWGEGFNFYSFLPRVEYKNCILSKAQWNLTKEDIEILISCKNNKSKLLSEVIKWRTMSNIPEIIQLVDGDNTLVVNLKNYNSIIMFLETIKRRDKFIIVEFLGFAGGLVKEKGESYCNQFLFSFYNHYRLKENIND